MIEAAQSGSDRVAHPRRSRFIGARETCTFLRDTIPCVRILLATAPHEKCGECARTRRSHGRTHARTHARTSVGRTTRAEIWRGLHWRVATARATPASFRVAINSVASRVEHACYSCRRLTCSSAIFHQSRIIYSEARITCQPPFTAAAGACLHRRSMLHASTQGARTGAILVPPSALLARMKTRPASR